MVRRLPQLSSTQIIWFSSSISSTCRVGYCDGGGGPQVGEVTNGGSPTYHVNVIKLKWGIIWTGGLPHLSGLPHLPGVPQLHVNRPLIHESCKLQNNWVKCAWRTAQTSQTYRLPHLLNAIPSPTLTSLRCTKKKTKHCSLLKVVRNASLLFLFFAINCQREARRALYFCIFLIYRFSQG